VAAATFISSRLGKGFGLAMMFLGVVAFIQGNFIGGMWWFLIGLFLRRVAEASYQQLLLHDVLHDQPVKRFMRRDPVTVSPSVTVRQWIEVGNGSRIMCTSIISRCSRWSTTRI
jgi:hypothetical protein